MQAVQRTDAQAWAISPRQIRADVVNPFWHRCLDPYFRYKVRFQVIKKVLCILSRNSSVKNLLRNSVEPLRMVKRREPNAMTRLHKFSSST